ncbi:MAG: hypothetical protein U9Q71_03355 [Pseudomonadota bacterium]|nr:hypothetical protein [Pseudomonadota bacterium]
MMGVEDASYTLAGKDFGLDGGISYSSAGGGAGYQLKLEGKLKGEAPDLELPDSDMDLRQGSLAGRAGLTVAVGRSRICG